MNKIEAGLIAKSLIDDGTSFMVDQHNGDISIIIIESPSYSPKIAMERAKNRAYDTLEVDPYEDFPGMATQDYD